jgi:hypothetical protein
MQIINIFALRDQLCAREEYWLHNDTKHAVCGSSQEEKYLFGAILVSSDIGAPNQANRTKNIFFSISLLFMKKGKPPRSQCAAASLLQRGCNLGEKAW